MGYPSYCHPVPQSKHTASCHMRLPCTADWSWRRAIIKIASPAMQDLPKGDLACWRLNVPMSCAALKISKACSFLSFLTLSTTCIFDVHASIATSNRRRKSCRNYWHWPWPRALRRRPLRRANGISKANLMDGTSSLVVDETVSIFFPECKQHQRQSRRKLRCQ